MSEESPKYYMTISLNVLNHMGLNLYSNTPAVLAEVVANSWDADATNVDIEFDIEDKTVTIIDDGCGMDRDDINDKYLYVGYQKRSHISSVHQELLTPIHKRLPMGRKGIGKLSLFSIANKIKIHTRKKNAEPEAFLMDANRIRKAIDGEDPSKIGRYEPEPIPINGHIHDANGTSIQITELKKLRLTQSSIKGLRRRIARRFSVIGDIRHFNVKINGQLVTMQDRDYFDKARFIYQYDADFAKHCSKLAKSKDGKVIGAFDQDYKFNERGERSETGPYFIRGWIAIAWRSNDLDGDGSSEDYESNLDGVGSDNENLNKITIIVRGKVAQEDILQEFRLGGMITKYMFGEIEADFLDRDGLPDIATSSRQRISEDDERYKALTNFIHAELKVIWTQTNQLRERYGAEHALSSNPHLREWYQSIRPPNLRKFADRIFGDIDKAGIEETERQRAYANGVMLFEHLKMNHAMDLLQEINVAKIDEFLSYLNDVDALEAEHYRQIVEERLIIIRRLRENVDEGAKERILQEYVFDHLFLLDPAWERATQFAEMEKHMEKVLMNRKRIDIKYIKYRRVAAAHVVVELKRPSVKVSKTELESQVTGYMNTLREELSKSTEDTARLPIEGVCIVGQLPVGWNDKEKRNLDERSLALYKIRVLTYDELIENAYNAYGKFIKAYESKSKLRELIEQVRAFNPNASNPNKTV